MWDGAVRIEVVAAVTADLLAALRVLLSQMSQSAPELTASNVEDIVRAPHCTLFVARESGDAGRIIGTATLVVFQILSGRRARVESVVVDQGARNRGVGEALCRAALAKAENAGVSAVDLSSSPGRLEANRLYVRLGFQLRDTNVYRRSFESPTKLEI